MKTIKIHKILTKTPSDPWIINYSRRISNTTDPRDPLIQLYSRFSETQSLTIAKPYQQLFIEYSGFVGYDREYINDNTVDFYYVFQIEDNADPVTFAINFYQFINQNPISTKWFALLEEVNVPKYTVNCVVEDETGLITEI